MAVNTTDPALRSWVKSARTAGTDFPIQNLPYGVARTQGDDSPHIVVAIGDQALDLHTLASAPALAGLPAGVLDALRQPVLNALMAAPREAQRALRERLSGLLEEARFD